MNLDSKELYEANRLCRSGSSYRTDTGVLVTYGGSANAPHKQFIRVSNASRSLRFDGYWSAESIYHALNQFHSLPTETND